METIRRWWRSMGQPAYPKATRLLITADAGGSNGSRLRLWKVALQQLADETALRIFVCHFPPGTSKWNKIEHRLFSYISQNWRGKPLRSFETIVNLIASQPVISSGPAQDLCQMSSVRPRAATTTAITTASLVVGTVTTAASSTVATGKVISENPLAGTSVDARIGSQLSCISSGLAQVSVPNVFGQTQAVATTSIPSELGGRHSNDGSKQFSGDGQGNQ